MEEGGIIVGIDLGTTNSLVGVVDSGFPILLADGEGNRLLPSAVCLPEAGDGGEPVVGAAALRMQSVHPDRVITSVKRYMGWRVREVDGVGDSRIEGTEGERVRLRAGERSYEPEEISAMILRRLVETAEAAIDQKVARAVITVPAYFNDAQRNETKRAGELAGLQVERIVNEPTAAALAYGLDRLKEKSRVVVYDFGGGTFDVSILELNEGVFQVLATHGDTQLGGDDVDRLVAGILGEGASRLEEVRLLEAARGAKEKLSSEENVTVRLPFVEGGEHLERKVTRRELEELVTPLLERTRRHCLEVLQDAKLEAGDLDEVILVGGSTRIPAVRELVAEIFGREPNLSQHPDEAVGLGATVQAGILEGSLHNLVLLDVTPLSLGIETFGGLMNVIIARNTTIPAKAGEMFTNAVDHQESMLVRVLQGEREMARDNWELGKLEVPFPAGPRGSARVGVQFRIDENGILEVLARDTAENRDVVLEISDAAVDVEDEAVEAMIGESVEHAFEDMNERVFTEARLVAAELLPAVEEGLKALGDVLGEDEIERIKVAAAEVREALAANPPDVRRLKDSNAALDAATQTLASLLVDKALDEAAESI